MVEDGGASNLTEGQEKRFKVNGGFMFMTGAKNSTKIGGATPGAAGENGVVNYF